MPTNNAVPALQVYISDSGWPNMELLVVSGTGKTYNSMSMYDIAPSQFQAQITNALREVLQAAIDGRKAKEKAAK